MLDIFQTHKEQKRLGLFKNKKKKKDELFEEIYDKYASLVYGCCKFYLKSDEPAKDILQETFVKFYKVMDNNYEISNYSAYLVRSAKNLCQNYIRDRKITVDLDANELRHNEDKYENRELFELIISALEYLDEGYREIFIKHELEGRPYSELAEEYSTSVENLRVQVFRAKKKVIEILKPYIDDLNK